MPITRAQATQLLNQGEMALYDDSRINGLRQLDARALGARIDALARLIQQQQFNAGSKDTVTGSRPPTPD